MLILFVLFVAHSMQFHTGSSIPPKIVHEHYQKKEEIQSCPPVVIPHFSSFPNMCFREGETCCLIGDVFMWKESFPWYDPNSALQTRATITVDTNTNSITNEVEGNDCLFSAVSKLILFTKVLSVLKLSFIYASFLTVLKGGWSEKQYLGRVR